PGGPAAPVAGSGEIMVMDPLAIPKDASAPMPPSRSAAAPAPIAGTAPAPSATSEVPTPPVVRALTGHGIRVVMFAAAGSAGGADAYDGVIVERIAPAASPAAAATPTPAKPAKPKTAPPH